MLVKRLHPNAKLPTRGTEQSAGLDLYAIKPCVLYPNSPALIPTGIAVQLPPLTCGQIWPRSGKSIQYSVSVDAGIIDEDYRGEIHVALFNKGDRPWRIDRGERIAQLVIVPVELCEAVEVDELAETIRGKGGFGSTGI